MTDLPIIRLEISRMKQTIMAMLSKEGAALSSEINRAVLEYLSDDNINHIVRQEVRDTVNAAVKEEIRDFFKETSSGRLAIREAVLNRLNEVYTSKVPTETKLIKMVREIDPEAAEWILDNIPSKDIDTCCSIAALFVWIDTPQGHKYWEDIARVLDLKEE